MDKIDKIFIIGFSIIAIYLLYQVPLIMHDYEKIDEIPQYNCYILHGEMIKWTERPMVYEALEKEWFVKQCWEQELKDNEINNE